MFMFDIIIKIVNFEWIWILTHLITWHHKIMLIYIFVYTPNEGVTKIICVQCHDNANGK